MAHPANQSLGGDVGSLKPPRMEDQVHSNLLIVVGVPPNTLGANGQWALRTDSTASGSRVYQKIGGIWTATTL